MRKALLFVFYEGRNYSSDDQESDQCHPTIRHGSQVGGLQGHVFNLWAASANIQHTHGQIQEYSNTFSLAPLEIVYLLSDSLFLEVA